MSQKLIQKIPLRETKILNHLSIQGVNPQHLLHGGRSHLLHFSQARSIHLQGKQHHLQHKQHHLQVGKLQNLLWVNGAKLHLICNQILLKAMRQQYQEEVLNLGVVLSLEKVGANLGKKVIPLNWRTKLILLNWIKKLILLNL